MFYWPKISKSLFITKFNFFMGFDYFDKSAYDTDIAAVLAIDQTCFSDAIFFLWGVLSE